MKPHLLRTDEYVWMPANPKENTNNTNGGPILLASVMNCVFLFTSKVSEMVL